MNLVLVSDIFGKTAALKALAEELNAQSIVDPYGGVDMAFNSEQQAYEYFSHILALMSMSLFYKKRLNHSLVTSY
ncbi:hypothetical protein QMA03_10980 [Pseudoalteromonas sp. APC 3356]|uniref:hypothetical protein n=1 Tax=Pseudoalteromonas TaxID=53246 RepID=UPI0002DF6E15|nr:MULTISPECIES: hypothetical protein [unclassified Pseudoalteromonas]KGK03078.1 hypothetical protein ND6B_0229 [Pseudoalteromonas sp. ND6B]MDN3434922.1 hypothetical protein [Pseudoalteromonas sp. APC 3356]